MSYSPKLQYHNPFLWYTHLDLQALQELYAIYCSQFLVNFFLGTKQKATKGSRHQQPDKKDYYIRGNFRGGCHCSWAGSPGNHFQWSHHHTHFSWSLQRISKGTIINMQIFVVRQIASEENTAKKLKYFPLVKVVIIMRLVINPAHYPVSLPGSCPRLHRSHQGRWHTLVKVTCLCAP